MDLMLKGYSFLKINDCSNLLMRPKRVCKCAKRFGFRSTCSLPLTAFVLISAIHFSSFWPFYKIYEYIMRELFGLSYYYDYNVVHTSISMYFFLNKNARLYEHLGITYVCIWGSLTFFLTFATYYLY